MESPRIRGDEDVHMFAILADAAPVGMIQIGPVEHQHAAGPRACSIDFLIGDKNRIGCGLGPRVIDAFVTDEVFDRRGFSVCLADPHEDNQRSVRAFEKAGFVLLKRFQQEGQTFLLLALARPAPSP